MAGVARLELVTSGLTGHSVAFTSFYLSLLNPVNILLISHYLFVDILLDITLKNLNIYPKGWKNGWKNGKKTTSGLFCGTIAYFFLYSRKGEK